MFFLTWLADPLGAGVAGAAAVVEYRTGGCWRDAGTIGSVFLLAEQSRSLPGSVVSTLFLLPILYPERLHG